ncbi:MAG: anti-sigma factor [Candidatus Sulfotelmatobacter sp.]
MNCVELRESLIETDDGRSVEQRAHLKTCRECSAMVADLNAVASAAVELRGADEPDPRVWKSIEAELRREGLIRPQRSASRSLLPSFGSPWGIARWLVPAAAALLIAVGIYVRPHSAQPIATGKAPTAVASSVVADIETAGLNDDDLLQEGAQQSPAVKEQYSENLRRVNEYIQDEKNVVAANPNDEEARRSLMDAYQEKAMLFELALDRSLQ